ncbi:MAG: glycosyltransferase family A protein [Acidimicrobiales bacterium]
MTTATRRVSVIVPVYNRRDVVAETVESVLAQTHPDVEVHIVDDGSTDGTRERITELAAADARVHVSHQKNAGPGAARNRGLAAADTEWIAFCDSDDLLPVDSIERRFAWLDANPDHDAVIGRGRTEIIAGADVPPVIASMAAAGDVNPIVQTVLIRRSDLLGVGGYDENMRTGEDTDLFFRLRRAGVRIGVAEDVYLIRRVHGDNLSHENTRMAKGLLDIVRKDVRESRQDR